MNERKVLDLAIFLNGYRGLKSFLFLKKKKKLLIKLIFIAKKNLDKNIIIFLKKNKIKYLLTTNKNQNKISKIVAQEKIDLNILCGYPYILKKKLIRSSKFGTLNLHAGRLPKYRGGSPLNWQIINNEKKIGISVIKIDEGIDTGPIIENYNFRLLKKDNIIKLNKKVNKLFPPLLYKAIKKIKNNNSKILKKQKKGSYFPQRNKQDSKIDWKLMSNVQISNLIKASNPNSYPAYFENLKKKKIFILKGEASNIKKKGYHPGQILNIKKNMFIKSRIGFLKIIEHKGKFY